jgi:hypothetical protein
MCDPTAIALGGLVIGAGSAVADHAAQDKAYKENKAASIRAMKEAAKDISLMQAQEQDAARVTIMQADRQARSSKALAAVAAGEAGVTGASVDALLGDIDRELGEFTATTERNLSGRLKQLEREKVSGRTVAQNRINSMSPGNYFLTGARIASAGLDAASQISRQRTPA